MPNAAMALEIEMTEEVLAETSAIAPVETTTPDVVAVTSEAAPEAASKLFSQEELDAAIGKRLAVAQRKWERESQPKPQPAAVPQVTDVRPEQFGTTEEYADALATRKAEAMVAQRDSQRVQHDALAAYQDREETARAKYEDFEQVAYNPRLTISDAMAQTIQSSDIGPEIAYHLGTHPTEAARIAKLAPLAQAKEIGMIEAKLSAAPPTIKKTTNAPAPISPVTAKGTPGPSFDTTDPRSIKEMSTSAWIAAERIRETKRMEARGLR